MALEITRISINTPPLSKFIPNYSYVPLLQAREITRACKRRSRFTKYICTRQGTSQNMENSSPNQSAEGPSGCSDSDMSADESASVDKNRIASLVQEKRVLTVELETYKLKCKQLLEENKALRKASVNIVSNCECFRGFKPYNIFTIH